MALILLMGCASHAPLDFSSLLGPNKARQLTPDQGSVIEMARSLLGTPYRFGGTTPEGFDCSGLINYVYRKAAGMTLPRNSHRIARAGRAVSVDELRPADILHFKIERQRSLHVVIYIGEGKFIHAPKTGGKVSVQKLNVNYWTKRYRGARRVL